MDLTWNPDYLATQQGAFSDTVTFEERPEEGEDGALRMSWERVYQAEGSGSAQTLGMECP